MKHLPQKQTCSCHSLQGGFVSFHQQHCTFPQALMQVETFNVIFKLFERLECLSQAGQSQCSSPRLQPILSCSPISNKDAKTKLGELPCFRSWFSCLFYFSVLKEKPLRRKLKCFFHTSFCYHHSSTQFGPSNSQLGLLEHQVYTPSSSTGTGNPEVPLPQRDIL